MGLEGRTLSEVSQTERQIPYDFTYMWNPKNKINKIETDSLIQRTD